MDTNHHTIDDATARLIMSEAEFASRVEPRESDREELAGEVRLDLVRRLAEGMPPHHGFIWKAANWAVSSIFRRRTRAKRWAPERPLSLEALSAEEEAGLAPSLIPADPAPCPRAICSQKDRNAALARAINRLESSEAREILLRLYFDRATLQELADERGIGESMMSKYAARYRIQLRPILDEELDINQL